MYNPFSLKGKTILVTGASSGIGKATAVECARMSARLIITGRNQERLNEVFNLLEGEGHFSFCGDLCDSLFLDSLVNNLPELDGVFHSAGIIMHLPFKFTTNEKLDKIFDINFRIPTILSSILVRKKKIKKDGSFVFMSSVSGVLGTYPGGSLYSATKGAINGMLKGMALDLAPQGIRVNSIIAGMIETNIMHEEIVTPEQLEKDKKRYPLGRYGKPEEIAYAAIYLLSDASLWTTGSNILIDGGITL